MYHFWLYKAVNTSFNHIYKEFITKVKKIISQVNDELKYICKIEHTRHRSVKGFIVKIIAILTAYCFFPKKPSLTITPIETDQLILWLAYTLFTLNYIKAKP